MKKLLAIVVLSLLWNANVIAAISIGSEELSVTTFPNESRCTLSNDKGSWTVVTPGVVKIKKSNQPLRVDCIKENFQGSEIFALKDSGNVGQGEIKKDIAEVAIDTALGGNSIFGTIGNIANAGSKLLRLNKYALYKKGTYGTTYNKDGIATIYIILKSK